MQKYKILVFLLVVTTMQLAAQHSKDRIKAFRAAIFVEELQLTTKEAESFWPIYNAYEREREALQQRYQSSRKQIDLLSDKEAEKQVEEMFKMEEEQIALKRKYYTKFGEVLSVRKVIRIPKAEQRFRKLLLERIKDAKDIDSLDGN
jgi:chromosome segregation ATPase